MSVISVSVLGFAAIIVDALCNGGRNVGYILLGLLVGEPIAWACDRLFLSMSPSRKRGVERDRRSETTC